MQQDHQVFGLALVAGRVEGLARQIGRGKIAERATALLADYVEYLMVSHLAVKLAGVLLGPHLLDGKEEGVGGVDGEGVDQGIVRKGHHGRVQGAMAETGAGTEEADGEDQQGEGGAPVPAGEA